MMVSVGKAELILSRAGRQISQIYELLTYRDIFYESLNCSVSVKKISVIMDPLGWFETFFYTYILSRSIIQGITSIFTVSIFHHSLAHAYIVVH